MTNLNYLSKETLINIVLDLDYQLNVQQNLEAQNLQIMLNKAYKDLEEMNSTRQFWKSKFLELETKAKEAGLIKSFKRAAVKDEPKKEFKITRAGGKKPLIKIQKETYKEEPVIEEVKIDEDKVYIPKNTYSHSIESTKGNIQKSKHSGHRTNQELLVGKFPKGEVKEFESVNDAKDYIRKAYPEFKTSPLTNISRAARGSGFYTYHTAYNTIWNYIKKENENV